MTDYRSLNQMRSANILCDMDEHAGVTIEDEHAHFDGRIFDSDDEYVIEAMVDARGMITDYKIRVLSQSLRTENMDSDGYIDRREGVKDTIRRTVKTELDAVSVSVDNVFVGDINTKFIVRPEADENIEPDILKRLVDAIRRGVSEF